MGILRKIRIKVKALVDLVSSSIEEWFDKVIEQLENLACSKHIATTGIDINCNIITISIVQIFLNYFKFLIHRLNKIDLEYVISKKN